MSAKKKESYEDRLKRNLPTECFCEAGVIAETKEAVKNQKGDCIITEIVPYEDIDEETAAQIRKTRRRRYYPKGDMVLKGFYKNFPETEILLHSNNTSICKLDDERPEKLDKKLELMSCLKEIVDEKDPEEALFPYAVSSVERNMAKYNGYITPIKECFKKYANGVSEDLIRDTFDSASSCVHIYNNAGLKGVKPSKMKVFCDAAFESPRTLSSIVENAKGWDENELDLIGTMVQRIGSTFGSRLANTAYTRWSGD